MRVVYQSTKATLSKSPLLDMEATNPRKDGVAPLGGAPSRFGRGGGHMCECLGTLRTTLLSSLIKGGSEGLVHGRWAELGAGVSTVSGRKSFPNRKIAQGHSLDSRRAQERKRISHPTGTP